jgi:isoleucyl-tRNA synthetase
MQLAQDACSLLLSLRKKANIKVRQPLQKALIPLIDASVEGKIKAVEDIIRSEVNIKTIEFMSADQGVIKKKIKPNFKELGTRMGAMMKKVAGDIATFTDQDILQLERDGHIDRVVEGETVHLLLSDVEIASDDIPGLLVANKGSFTIALDIQLTPELEQEGMAREFVNKIQKSEKTVSLN